MIWESGAKASLVTSLGIIEVNSSLHASVKGVEIEIKPPDITIAWDHQTLATLSLDEALIGFRSALSSAYDRLSDRQKIELQKEGAEVSVPVAGGTASFSSDGELSFSTTRGGVTTTFTLGATGEISVSASITEQLPKPVPQVGTVPVDVQVSTTLSVVPGVKQRAPSPDEPTVEPVPQTQDGILQIVERWVGIGTGTGPQKGSGVSEPSGPGIGWEPGLGVVPT